MPRYRVCKQCGECHDVDNWPDNHREWIIDNRSDLAAPMIIRDTMSPTKGMHDGKIYESKRAMRQSYRDHGVIEVGNDSSVMNPQPRPKRKPDRAGVRAAVSRAVSLTNLTRRKRDELPTR
jgi:hypothetical protein